MDQQLIQWLDRLDMVLWKIHDEVKELNAKVASSKQTNYKKAMLEMTPTRLALDQVRYSKAEDAWLGNFEGSYKELDDAVNAQTEWLNKEIKE
ncbi:MAG: hypothetical protein WC292_00260 [Clostridia bacterium]